MTEREYVLATELRTTRHLMTMLKEIVPGVDTNECVPLDEYRRVSQILSSWENRLTNAVKITER